MRKLTIITLLLFSFCSPAKKFYLPTGDQILSSDDYFLWGTKELEWSDFRGKILSTKFSGGTFAGLSFAKDSLNRMLIFTYFDRRRSWRREELPEGLIHEKYHFNIVEVFTRSIRKDYADKVIVIDTSIHFRKYVDSIWDRVELMQAEYDSATDMSRDTLNQKIWQQKIDWKLDSLKGFDRVIN